MHVLIVAEADLRSQGSGAERSLVGHVTGLLGRGHRVTVLSGGTGAPTRRGALAVERVGWSLRTPWRVRAAAEAIRTRVDVTLTYHAFPAWRLVRSPRLGRVPLVYVFMSPWGEEYAVRYPDRTGPVHALGCDLRRRVERQVIRRAARVCPMSRFMGGRASAIHGVPPEAIRVVPGGVDVERFRPASERDAFRRRFGVAPDAPLLLTLRNLEPRMGVDALLAAMPGVLARHPGARLVVGGTGPLRAELEALARRLGLGDRVLFPGFIPEAELAAVYAAADLFVLPTRALEGFGLVTLEALACGTPVLGSRVGATPELLEPLDAGLLLADTTPHAVEASILAFLARPDRAALAARCRAHAEPYAWSRVAAALEGELEALVETPRAGRRA